MSFFNYEAVDKSGRIINGKIEADQDSAAVERLQRMGYTVLEVIPAKRSSFQFKKRVKIGDLCVFSRQLASMLEAGIPLARALLTLGREAVNPTLREAILTCHHNVEGGMSFSESLRSFPEVFPQLFVNMIYSGEIGGTMDTVLRHLSRQLERDKELRDNIRSASIYPMAVICFAFLISLLMLFVIVPLFIKFFPADLALPLPTRIVLGLSASLRNFWYFWLLGAVALVYALRSYLRSNTGSRKWDSLKLRLPVLGQLFKKVAMARFARTLQSLLSSGIPVIQALEAAGKATANLLVAEAAHLAGEQIQEGKSIAAPLEESKMFTPMLVQMVMVGEESGNLPFLLESIADFYEAEVATMTKGLSSLIEPILIIFIGCIVGFIVISLYLPIFLVTTHFGGQ